MSSKTVILLVLLLTALVSCSEFSDTYDYPENSLPAITVSHQTATVGEAVTVKVSETFDLSAASSMDAFTMQDLSLGACLIIKEPPVVAAGLCREGSRTDNGPLEALDGTSFLRAYGDIVIRRGELLVIDHTFTLTSEKPATVELSAVVQFLTEGTSRPSPLFGSGTTVTFK